MATIPLQDAATAFLAQLASRNIVLPAMLEDDGRIHRLDIDGKRGKRDAAYIFHSDGIPAGGFENWVDGLGWQTWCAKAENTFTDSERAEYKARQTAYREARRVENESRRAAASGEAAGILAMSEAVTEHPYLTRKKVASYGLTAVGPLLVIPAYNVKGELTTLQTIDDAGNKRFLKDGKKSGSFYTIGDPDDVIYVVEGYATGASVHDATLRGVLVAFDCGNLMEVGKAAREKWPYAKIVFCADNDRKTVGNPGVTKATDAAKACGGIVAIPVFPNGSENLSDFNDLAVLSGEAAVSSQISDSLMEDTGYISAREWMAGTISELERRKTGSDKGSLLTGIRTVDAFTGGLRIGGLTVIGGLPGWGKTSAATGIALYNSLNNVPCYFISLEMSRFDLGCRLLSAKSGVPAMHIMNDRENTSSMDWDRVKKSSEALKYARWTLDDKMLSINQIMEESYRWHARDVRAHGLTSGLIVVDYLGLIRSEDNNHNRNREVAAMVTGLKTLAKELRVNVIALSQLNRRVSTSGGEPGLGDFRDSGEIEAAGDLIICPFPAKRDEDGIPLRQGDDEPLDKWIILKNKNGKTGGVEVAWHQETMTYTDARQAYSSDRPPMADLYNPNKGN